MQVILPRAGGLTQQGAMDLAAGQAKIVDAGADARGILKYKPVVLSYRVTDGDTEYLLDLTNTRVIFVAQNIIAVVDNVQ